MTGEAKWLRAGLGFLAAVEIGLGLWTLLLPKSFFDLRWVSYFPPYNEHLMRDYGGLTLGIAVILIVATVTMERRLVLTALSAYLVVSGSHFAFHAVHLEHFTVGDAITQTAGLAGALVIPVALLLLARTLPPMKVLKENSRK